MRLVRAFRGRLVRRRHHRRPTFRLGRTGTHEVEFERIPVGPIKRVQMFDATPVLIEDDAHELNERLTGTHVEGVGSFARRQGRADALTRAVCLDAGALEQF